MTNDEVELYQPHYQQLAYTSVFALCYRRLSRVRFYDPRVSIIIFKLHACAPLHHLYAAHLYCYTGILPTKI